MSNPFPGKTKKNRGTSLKFMCTYVQKCEDNCLLCSGLTTRQTSFCVISQKKGGEIVEEIKERDRGERGK